MLNRLLYVGFTVSRRSRSSWFYCCSFLALRFTYLIVPICIRVLTNVGRVRIQIFLIQSFFLWNSVRVATRFFAEYQDNNLHLEKLSLRSSCIYLLFRENKIVLYRKIAIFEFVVVLLPVRKPWLCHCWPTHNNLQSNKFCLITFNWTILYCSCEKCLQMQISI